MNQNDCGKKNFTNLTQIGFVIPSLLQEYLSWHAVPLTVPNPDLGLLTTYALHNGTFRCTDFNITWRLIVCNESINTASHGEQFCISEVRWGPLQTAGYACRRGDLSSRSAQSSLRCVHVEFHQWTIPVVAPMSNEGRKMVAKENSCIVPIFPLMKLNLHQMILNTISRCAPLKLRVKIYILLHYHTNWRKNPHMHGRHGHAVVEKQRRELGIKNAI